MKRLCYISGYVFGKCSNVERFYEFYSKHLNVSYKSNWHEIEMMEDSFNYKSDKVMVCGFRGVTYNSIEEDFISTSNVGEDLGNLAKRFSVNFELYSSFGIKHFQEYAYIDYNGYVKYTKVDFICLYFKNRPKFHNWYKCMSANLINFIESSDYLMKYLEDVVTSNYKYNTAKIYNLTKKSSINAAFSVLSHQPEYVIDSELYIGGFKDIDFKECNDYSNINK